MTIRAGRLRHQISIQRPIEVKDGKGGYLDNQWDDVATVWADVVALDGHEALIGRVFEGSSTYRIVIRWRGDLRADWQLIYGDLTLNIAAPPSDPDGRRRELVITASTASALKPA